MRLRFRRLAVVALGLLVATAATLDYREKAVRIERRATLEGVQITVYQPDEGLYTAFLPRRCVLRRGERRVTLRMDGDSQDRARLFVDPVRHELLLGQARSRGFLVNARSLAPESLNDATYQRLAQLPRFLEWP